MLSHGRHRAGDSSENLAHAQRTIPNGGREEVTGVDKETGERARDAELADQPNDNV